MKNIEKKEISNNVPFSFFSESYSLEKELLICAKSLRNKSINLWEKGMEYALGEEVNDDVYNHYFDRAEKERSDSMEIIKKLMDKFLEGKENEE